MAIAFSLLVACSDRGGSDNGRTDGDAEPVDTTPSVGDPGPNSAPTLTAVDSVRLSSPSRHVTVGVEAFDADADTVQISWSVVSSPAEGDLTITPSADSLEAELHATVAGDYDVLLQASDGVDVVRHSIRVHVVDVRPRVDRVTIDPAAPRAGDVLTAEHDPVVDTNGSAQTQYRWFVNGAMRGTSSSPQMPRVSFGRGDRIEVELTVSEDTDESRVRSAPVTVRNSRPRAVRVDLLPAAPRAHDDIAAAVIEPSDPDGDAVLSDDYVWSVNGQRIASQTANVLPAGQAVAGDSVSVEVTLTDGIEDAVLSSRTVEILASQYRLRSDPADLVFEHGESATFSATFVDDRGEPVATQLTRGPKGLDYSSETGEGTWTPTVPMSSHSERYGATFVTSDGHHASLTIRVRDSDLPLLRARSGIAIPNRDVELAIADFDGDGRNEVLSTDLREQVFTLEFDGQTLVQDWVYPFSIAPGESVLNVWPFGDDQSQVLVATSRGISMIEARFEPPTRLLDTSYDVRGAALGDLDADGVDDLLLIDGAGTMTAYSTADWSATTLTGKLTAKSSSFGSYSIVLGNVDTDPALEIVVDTGQVVDGGTGELQWSHFSTFGSLIALGDLDGDGDVEIAASDRWGNVTSYDPVARTSLWTYDINDLCSLRLYDVDDDGQDELIAGPCQHGAVEVYDASGRSAILLREIDDPDYNSGIRSYSLGDLDADGVDDLVFSTGSSSTAPDNMAVISLAGLNDKSRVLPVFVGQVQARRFVGIGWEAGDAGRAVFVLPDTDGPEDGQRVAVLGTEGPLVSSAVTAPNWDDIAAGVVVDSDADGVAEAIVGVGNVRDGEVHHLDLDDLTSTHVHHDIGSTVQESDPDIVAMVLGVDGDGQAKAIIATSVVQFQVYDIESRQADWTSGGLSGGTIRAVDVLQHGSGFDVFVATSSELTRWTRSTTGYQKTATANIACSLIRTVQLIDGDQLACLDAQPWDDVSTLTLFDTALTESHALDLDYRVSALESTPDNQLLLGVSTDAESYYSPSDNRLRTIDPLSGSTTWTSAPMLGVINQIRFSDIAGDGTIKASISTSTAAYIVNAPVGVALGR